MLQQEKEFGAWGLSKLLIRNVIVAVIVGLTGAASFLYFELRESHKEQERLTKEILVCEKRATESVERFKNEQLSIYQRIIAEQKEVAQEMEKMTKRVRRLK